MHWWNKRGNKCIKRELKREWGGFGTKQYEQVPWVRGVDRRDIIESKVELMDEWNSFCRLHSVSKSFTMDSIATMLTTLGCFHSTSVSHPSNLRTYISNAFPSSSYSPPLIISNNCILFWFGQHPKQESSMLHALYRQRYFNRRPLQHLRSDQHAHFHRCTRE